LNKNKFAGKSVLLMLMEKRIYIISGLGADERFFSKLHLGDFSVTHLNWIEPIRSESIEGYAKRFAENIIEDDAILIGLSFGGMMAVELSKIKRFEKIILISSAKSKFEIPWYYQWIGKLKIHHLVPGSFYKLNTFFVHWLFSTKSYEDKNLLKEILHDSSASFFTWAIDKIVTWKNTEVPQNLIHIHGTEDKILPYRYVKADYTIEGGGHMMVFNRAGEFEKVILGVL
jgi:pimeloyl-ACP methyl ester carboxylesterase